MPELVDQKTVFSLLEVSKSIQKTFADRYKSLYWIKAEMNKLNHYSHSGHCYSELLEKKEGKIVAEMRSILWKMDFQRINKQFIEVLGEPLKDGITILFQAGISYDPLYGLSLKIVDIDPTFVLGELEKEKKINIQKLKDQGLFDANRRLPFPLLPKRLAIISVETSKGLSDFIKIINGNPWGYHFELSLYPALLQGDKSVPSIIKQLELIAERLESYDAVAIIRGGGGDVGLTSYNNFYLAKAIAIFPIPVLTGIGHSTNETVSEMVAFKNAITPSELADFLIQKFHNFSLPIEQAAERIQRSIKRTFEQEENKLSRMLESISWNSKAVFWKEKEKLQKLQVNMSQYARFVLKSEHLHIQQLDRMIGIVNPVHLLKRGFSIVRLNGKALNQINQVKIGDQLDIELLDGNLKTQLLKIEPKNEK